MRSNRRAAQLTCLLGITECGYVRKGVSNESCRRALSPSGAGGAIRGRLLNRVNMIKSITFCLNHWTKIKILDGKRHNEIRFEPGYNVLIGPNGSGKTTVLEAIAGCPLCKKEASANHRVKYISSESLNPLAGTRFRTIEEMVLGIRALFSSHGEAVRATLALQRYNGEDCILIDTPETGQDIDQCQSIHRRLKRMCAKYGIQVIVATHSPVFLQDARRVVELKGRYLRRILDANQEILRTLARIPGVMRR
jgi:predicted ATPase